MTSEGDPRPEARHPISSPPPAQEEAPERVGVFGWIIGVPLVPLVAIWELTRAVARAISRLATGLARRVGGVLAAMVGAPLRLLVGGFRLAVRPLRWMQFVGAALLHRAATALRVVVRPIVRALVMTGSGLRLGLRAMGRAVTAGCLRLIVAIRAGSRAVALFMRGVARAVLRPVRTLGRRILVAARSAVRAIVLSVRTTVSVVRRPLQAVLSQLRSLARASLRVLDLPVRGATAIWMAAQRVLVVGRSALGPLLAVVQIAAFHVVRAGRALTASFAHAIGRFSALARRTGAWIYDLGRRWASRLFGVLRLAGGLARGLLRPVAAMMRALGGLVAPLVGLVTATSRVLGAGARRVGRAATALRRAARGVAQRILLPARSAAGHIRRRALAVRGRLAVVKTAAGRARGRLGRLRSEIRLAVRRRRRPGAAGS